MAQVESGNVYRIVSAKYGTVITANPVSQELTCVAKGDESDYQQMWKFEEANNGKFYIMNVFSGRYIQNEERTNWAFKTGNAKVAFAVTENIVLKGKYNIDASGRAGGWGLHCASGATVVPWSNGPNDGEASGTEWVFEPVSIDDAEIAAAQQEYAAYNAVLSNRPAIINLVNNLFADNAGTILKEEYATMNDAALVAVMEGVPAELQQAVLKVKNNSWATAGRENLSEKNFRIYDYKPYSSPEEWKDILYHRPFNRINNPTGICSTSDKGFVYVFVDAIPEGTTMYLAEMNGTSYFGTDTQLVEGLNIIPSACKDGFLYIRYNCDTHTGFDVATKSGPKKLSDYPAVKVHVEGGYVNGFWSKERGHTNEDWVYMRDNMFKNPMAVQAVGDHSMLDFRTYEFLKECPNNIVGVMQLWDFWNERQRWYMNLDDYYDYFNNKQLAMSDDGGFMDAGNYRTHYNNNTLNTIVNYNLLITDGGSTWGPLHEIGHTNQYAIEIVGTSEVSNNALANFTLFDIGTHTSRGNNLENQILDYENNVPYVLREEGKYGKKLFSMTRMYFQLFLYFHAAGKNPEFYPTLFEELRADKLVGWVTSSQKGNNHPSGECDGNADHPMDANGFVLGSMDATNDQLKFVEKCCSIAQMDMTEFFEAWGFFIPMKNGYVGDYGHHHVYLLQDSIDAVKARIKKANYPKKGGHLMFLEDRLRPSKKKASAINSNTNGYRADYSWEVPVGEANGLYGQWEDYIDESVKAQGYYYAITDGKVTIIKDTNAGGALGFKLYDKASGKLLTYTNKESMKIPVLYLKNDLVVCAAQADGEDYVVPHASQGPESMQRDALEKSLSVAKKYTWRKATTGTEIGYFYPDSLAYLTQIYNDANKAFKNNDTSVRSYAEWSVMLDNECKRLVTTDGTRVMLEEGMTVKIQSVAKGGWLLTSSYSGVIAYSKTSPVNTESQWSIEYAGEEGLYYLRNGDGRYVSAVNKNMIVYANAYSTSEATAFTIEYTEDGNLYFTTPEGDNIIALGVSPNTVNVDGVSRPVVMGQSMTDTSTQWYSYVITNKSAEFYKQELENAVDEARFIITEVLNLDSLNTMNIFKNTIIVKDRNLEQYAVDLYNHYTAVVADIDNAKQHKNYLNRFRELLKRVEGTYIVTAPLATKGETIAWYRLKNTAEDGGYLSVNLTGSANNIDRLKLDAGSDDYSLWAFASTGRKNEYKIYNCGSSAYIATKEGKNANYLYVTEETMPFTVIYDSEKATVTLFNGEKYVAKSGSYVGLGAERNALNWTLELVALEENKEQADIITIVESVLEEGDRNADCYDLSGRKVENPGKGIYIQNGKKVIFK